MFRFYSSNHEEALSTGTSTSSEELAGLVSYRRDDFKNREKEIRDTQRKSGCLRLVLEDDALQFVDVVDKTEHLLGRQGPNNLTGFFIDHGYDRTVEHLVHTER